VTDTVLLGVYTEFIKEEEKMDELKNDKIERVLGIYTKLMNGCLVNKVEEAQNYGVNERSIQRDIDDIRNYLELDAENTGYINSVVYDRIDKGYRLEQVYKLKLTNSEVLALCKILLDSRAFAKKEMTDMLDKLISCCVPKSNQKLVTDLISNEAFHYVEPRHKTQFTDTMWDIGQAIRNCQYIEIDYSRMKDKVIVKRKVKPVAIMFSEYYFYLTAFIDDEEVRKDFDVINDTFPTIYRMDRIKKLNVLDEKFHIPYSSRFEEGEFRKRIQFMYGGKLQKVKFKYSGLDIDAVLDRLPTAQVLAEEDGVYTISAEVFGKGIDMWLRSQSDNIKKI
jgi:predicted DNA-binding transcriptional regulator YafY